MQKRTTADNTTWLLPEQMTAHTTLFDAVREYCLGAPPSPASSSYNKPFSVSSCWLCFSSEGSENGSSQIVNVFAHTQTSTYLWSIIPPQVLCCVYATKMMTTAMTMNDRLTIAAPLNKCDHYCFSHRQCLGQMVMQHIVFMFMYDRVDISLMAPLTKWPME